MKNNVVRRQRERAEMRLRVLDAARELFLSGGEDSVTLRRVAEQIGYSATTIYLYFQNKETLIQELCLADFTAYSRVLQQAERVSDPLARLRKVAAAYVDFGLLYPAHYRSMFIMAAAGDGRSESVAPVAAGLQDHQKVSPAAPDAYDYLHTAVFKAMAAGCFSARYRDVALIGQVIWSGLHGIVSLPLVRARYPGVAWRSVQSSAELMIECLVRGLTTEESI